MVDEDYEQVNWEEQCKRIFNILIEEDEELCNTFLLMKAWVEDGAVELQDEIDELKNETIQVQCDSEGFYSLK